MKQLTSQCKVVWLVLTTYLIPLFFNLLIFIFKGAMFIAHGVTDEDWNKLIDPTMKDFLQEYPKEKVAVDWIGPQVGFLQFF